MLSASWAGRSWAVALIAALALGATATATAGRQEAHPRRHFTIKKMIWGPVTFDGRSQFPVYRQLGAGIWAAYLSWKDVAPTQPASPRDPTDPAYQWPADIERAVGDARRYGIKVMLQVAATPPWANGGRPPNWVPSDPNELSDFVTAAARHYTSVKLWMIWGEPTRRPNFMPLTPERHGSNHLDAAQAAAPRYYARMLDASYGALKAVSRANVVIGGNTFTVGDISPYNWIRYLRLPGGRRPRMDMFGHNPFTARRPDLRGPHPVGTDVNYSDFSDLRKFVAVLDHNLRDPRGRPLKLFLSEFFLPTDHANHEFPFHVTWGVQARWLAAALAIVERWRRVYTLGWFSLYDDPPEADGREVDRGLITYGGRRKPSFDVFQSG